MQSLLDVGKENREKAEGKRNPHCSLLLTSLPLDEVNQQGVPSDEMHRLKLSKT